MLKSKRVFVCCVFLFTSVVCLFSNLQAQEDDIKRVMPVPRMLTVVEPDVQPYETFSLPKPLLGVDAVDYDPNYFGKNEIASELTSKIILRHDVGCLEFTYKPLRSLVVEVPQPNTYMRRKTVLYLVYRVRNLGNHLTTDAVVDERGYVNHKIVQADEISQDAKIKNFQPHIWLEGWVEDFDIKGSEYVQKSYLEIYKPYIVKQIELVDRTPGKLHNWNSISEMEIDVTKDENALGVWGVAVWEDVDPKINYVSVYIQGLSNAYQVSEKDNSDPVIRQKTLQLNFWRSGDNQNIEKDLISNGIPLSRSINEQANYCRFYNLPGPAVVGYEMETGTDRSMKLFEIDAKFDRKTFDSLMLPELRDGKLPAEVRKAFTDLGIDVPEAIALVNKINDMRWEFQIRDGDRIREFRVDHLPRFWVKEGKQVKILNHVENFWIYR